MVCAIGSDCCTGSEMTPLSVSVGGMFARILAAGLDTPGWARPTLFDLRLAPCRNVRDNENKDFWACRHTRSCEEKRRRRKNRGPVLTAITYNRGQCCSFGHTIDSSRVHGEKVDLGQARIAFPHPHGTCKERYLNYKTKY